MSNPQKIQLTPWHGGECPVSLNALIFIDKYDCCPYYISYAKYIDWTIKFNYAVIETEIIEPPHSTIIPPEVWAVLPDWVTCAATDKNKEVYVYEIEPKKDRDYFYESGFESLDVTGFKGVIPAKCPWQDSLVWGPGCEPKQQPAHGQE